MRICDICGKKTKKKDCFLKAKVRGISLEMLALLKPRKKAMELLFSSICRDCRWNKLEKNNATV